MLFLGAGLLVADDDLALAADGAADLDDAVDLGDLGGVLRTAGFEQLGHARQTTGDVLGLRDLARRLGERASGLDFLAFLDGDVRAGGNRVAGERLPCLSSTMTICGWRSSLCSMTTVPMPPVASSSSCFTVTPGIMSRNSSLPAFSERIGTLYGSHWAKASPFLTLAAVGDGDDGADDDRCSARVSRPSLSWTVTEPFLLRTMQLPSALHDAEVVVAARRRRSSP